MIQGLAMLAAAVALQFVFVWAVLEYDIQPVAGWLDRAQTPVVENVVECPEGAS